MDNTSNGVYFNKQKYDKNCKYPRHDYAHKNGMHFFIGLFIKGGYHMNLVEDTKLMAIVGSVMK